VCTHIAKLCSQADRVFHVLQREQYAAAGDEDMLRVIAELFENTTGQLVRMPTSFASATGSERVHGSVHEVETVRRRCVEGSVVYNLGTLESNVLAKLRATSYAREGLTDASNVPWLHALQQDLNMFVDALVFCTESRSLTNDSLQEVCPSHMLEQPICVTGVPATRCAVRQCPLMHWCCSSLVLRVLVPFK
jgi:hypothetical protein